ncbi:SseB family protein [Curtobacterium ammoniigenes]|uniref:SseB family protein n=1 Tax=Curtobacterium ammoniigenes TaxID=395387 RepID=UPI000B153939|nr:SseB family protein [Curtobacterium ammoniigenes]
MSAGISNGLPPEGGDAPGGADSAGTPWAGRSFGGHDDAYADDDGRADPRLVSAIEALQGGGSARGVVDAVRSARLLVPLLAEAGAIGHTADGRQVDKTQELAVVTVAGPDGRTVMPAFSSADTLTAWNPEARPVPVDARKLALAAVSEGTELIVVDPGGATEFLIRRPAVWSLGKGIPWIPSWEDPEVAAAFAASSAVDPRIAQIVVLPGDRLGRSAGPELRVDLAIAPGLDAQSVQAILGAVQRRWAETTIIAERVDSLSVAVRAAA